MFARNSAHAHQEGMAYVAILVILLLVSTMGLAFLFMTGAQATATMSRSDNMAAHYLAEAAVSHAAWRLTNDGTFPADTTVYYMHNLDNGRYGYKVRRHTGTTFATVAAVGATANNVVHQSYVLYVLPGYGGHPGDLENQNVEALAHSATNDALTIATKKFLDEDITITKISAYVRGAQSKDIRLALYDDNAGEPGDLIVETASDRLGSNVYHWHDLDIPSTNLTPGMYWVAIAFDQAGLKIMKSATGQGETRGLDYDAERFGFPASWGTSDSAETTRLSIYAN